MNNVGVLEKATQNRVIKFFVDKLHYTYLGDLHDGDNYNIMIDRLYAYLTGKGGYSQTLAKKALEVLVHAANNLQSGLYDANKEVYRLLKYGAKVKENPGEAEKTVYFIDWSDPS